MKGLFVLPILALALACDDAAVLEPTEDATFSAASAPMVLVWQETFDQPYAGESWVTPSGVLQMRDIDNGFFVTGSLVGYAHVYGRAMVDTRTGQGTASGSAHYDLTEPGVGTLDCRWESKIYDFPVFRQFGQATCTGLGHFEGWKLKMEGTNPTPGLGVYVQVAEVR